MAGAWCLGTCGICTASGGTALPFCLACAGCVGVFGSCLVECSSWRCLVLERTVLETKTLSLPFKRQGETLTYPGYARVECIYGHSPPITDLGTWECEGYSGGDLTIRVTWRPGQPGEICPRKHGVTCERVEYEWKTVPC